MSNQARSGWKVTAGLVGAGLGAAALFTVSGADAGTPPERIQLRDTVTPAGATAPAGVRAPARTTRDVDDRNQSVDGQSVDSPLRDADDSPDTAADSPDGADVDSPEVTQTRDDSPDDAPRAPAPAADDSPDVPTNDSPDAPADDSPDGSADDSE